MFPILRIKKYVACVIDIGTPAGVVFFPVFAFLGLSRPKRLHLLLSTLIITESIPSWKWEKKKQRPLFYPENRFFSFTEIASNLPKEEELKQKMLYESGQFVKKQQLVGRELQSPDSQPLRTKLEMPLLWGSNFFSHALHMIYSFSQFEEESL